MKQIPQQTLQQKQKMQMLPAQKLALEVLSMDSEALTELVREALEENPFLERKQAEDADLSYLPSTVDFRESLLRQVAELDTGGDTRNLLIQMILSLDDQGFLDSQERLIFERQEGYEEAFELLQELDPPGLGTSGPKEYLLFQAKEEKLRELIRDHLEDLAEGRTMQIAEALGISETDVQELISKLRRLSPRSDLNSQEKTLYPDIIVEESDRALQATLLRGSFPELILVNIGESVLEAQRRKAMDLIQALERRKQFMAMLTEKLITLQKDWFLTEGEVLRPLTRRELADELNVHESTVSRAVKDKVLSFRGKSIPLADLFARGTEGYSRDLICRQLKLLIDKEDKTRPYSDEALRKLLLKEGIRISRRTVALYRGKLGIPAALKRRNLCY